MSDDDGETSLELLERARAGDGAALDRLCGRYLPRLRRWARGRLPRFARERLDTDDLVQESLVQTLGHLEGFVPRHEAALQAYLRQALFNRVRDEVRRAARRPAAAELRSDARDPAPSPLEETIGNEAVERYEAALARLGEEDRAAVVARVELQGTYPELARALGKPSADAARMAVSRALVRLAKEMASG
jgi:RNA polymerase sigma-70 factor (ECF subfamily)